MTTWRLQTPCPACRRLQGRQITQVAAPRKPRPVSKQQPTTASASQQLPRKLDPRILERKAHALA